MIKCTCGHKYEKPAGKLKEWPEFPGYYSGECPKCHSSRIFRRKKNGKYEVATSLSLMKALAVRRP